MEDTDVQVMQLPVFGEIKEPYMSENKKTLVSRIHEKAEMVDRPFSMMLELTNACNHRCLFCSHRKMKRSIKMMELPFAKRMVDEAYDMGVRELALFMMGESFCIRILMKLFCMRNKKDMNMCILHRMVH